MNAQLLGLLAEAPIHAGSGQSTGFVDLPVTREAATEHPVIAGSSIKGALRDLARMRWRNARASDAVREAGGATWPEPGLEHSAGRTDQAGGSALAEEDSDGVEVDRVFGKQDRAGALIVSDARLLLLPVRSMTSSYRWITCPYLVERLLRDRQRMGAPGVDLDVAALHRVAMGGALAGSTSDILFLEERQLTRTGTLPAGLCPLLAELVLHEDTRRRLPDQLVVLHDHDFAWFARYGLTVTARNKLHEENKTSKNLWYEEALPPDTLLYLLLAERHAGTLTRVRSLFADRPYLQVGGNETVGQGWLAVALPDARGTATGASV